MSTVHCIRSMVIGIPQTNIPTPSTLSTYDFEMQENTFKVIFCTAVSNSASGTCNKWAADMAAVVIVSAESMMSSTMSINIAESSSFKHT